MQNGVDTMLANAKIEADAAVKNIREKLDYLDTNAKDYRFLFSDMDKMIGFEKDHFEMTVRVRIESHKKAEADKLEAQRIKIQQEEEAKAKRKAESEQAKKLEAALKEQHAEAMARIAEENRIERERMEAERQEKIRLEQHQRAIDIELHERKLFCDSQISSIKKDIEESVNKEIAEPVTISRTEYLKLKGDSAQLWKIIELWHQAKRMSECAERADSSSVRNKELVEARKVRQQAIDIIENR
jgi:hypothetical protein